MRSPQPQLVPLIVLTLLGAALLVGHAAIGDRLTSNPDRRARRAVRMTRRSGQLMLSAGVLLILGYALVG